MNPDGANLRRLTLNKAEDGFPAWSPDGKRIAFSSNRDGNHEIYVMNADGSDQKRLTNNNAEDWGPVWRPQLP
jgi:TolB protein